MPTTSDRRIPPQRDTTPTANRARDPCDADKGRIDPYARVCGVYIGVGIGGETVDLGVLRTGDVCRRARWVGLR